LFDTLKFKKGKKAKISPRLKRNMEKQKDTTNKVPENTPKRRPGRPRKYPIPENTIEKSKNNTEKDQKTLPNDQTCLFTFFTSPNNKDSSV
jgi:hypothetical protein